MSKINEIENAIIELEGGKFQKLLDAYLYKKYDFSNIQPLGVQTGTDKPTKGTPDSFVLTDDGKYILIMYGSVGNKAFDKIKNDILSCFEKDKLNIPSKKIDKIICAYTTTNLHIEQLEELTQCIPDIEIELLGLGTISHDLYTKYTFLASDFFNIKVDTGQILSIEDFITVYDKNKMKAPLNTEFCYRKKEIENVYRNIEENDVTLVTGAAGVGKTRLVIEVCKKFESEGWKVLCVKNNGLDIYEDIKSYISEKGEYLLFIDDGNMVTKLNYIFEYIMRKKDDLHIKVIITVRDYAKVRIMSDINEYTKAAIILIHGLNNDEIKGILKKNLLITNASYLKRIVEITKGNVRLAIMAGENSIKNGFKAIKNIANIFDDYYGKIILSTNLTYEEIIVLFVITLFGPLDLNKINIVNDILESFFIDEVKFGKICKGLNEKELIDLYLDEAVKLSDQSFGDFILKYVFYDKKIYLISSLLEIGFPRYKNKIIYVINTLLNLFHSKELQEYVSEQVNLVWDIADADKQKDYLISFHSLNVDKTLQILKKEIWEMNCISLDLRNFDFEKNKNHGEIENYVIDILGDFKYTEYYIDSITLLLIFFEKRPDLVMEFYHTFTYKLGYDDYSHQNDYNQEYELIRLLWKKCEMGMNLNNTLLFLNVISHYLKYEQQKTEAINFKSFNLITFNLILNEGNKKLRSFIWNILGYLYSNLNYHTIIINTLLEFSLINSKNDIKELFQYDLECINKEFLNNWLNLTIEECEILSQLELNAEKLEIKNELFTKFNDYKKYVVYKIMAKSNELSKDVEEKQKINIQNLINDYQYEDFKNLFWLVNQIESTMKKKINLWALKCNVERVFNLLEADEKKYHDILNIYLEEGAPCGENNYSILNYLINHFDFDNVLKRIEKTYFHCQHLWINALYEYCPKDKINLKIAEDYLKYLALETKQDQPNFPRLKNILKYNKIDSSFIEKVSQMVLVICDKNKYIIDNFLCGYIYDEQEIDNLFELYQNNLDLLKKLYFKDLEFEMSDHEGALIIRLIDLDQNIWDEYTKYIVKRISQGNFECKIFDEIWVRKDYKKLIDTAYINLSNCKRYEIHFSGLEDIFINTTKTTDIAKENKKKWLKEYILENKLDVNKIIYIFEIINSTMRCWLNELIIFLMENTNYDLKLFKKIPLNSSFLSYSGSEVPLIENQIESIEILMKKMKGLDYIDHRLYLKERIEKLKKYKQQIMIEEYVEDIA